MMGHPDYDAGDLVVCVDDVPRVGCHPFNVIDLAQLNVGKVYRVSRLGILRDGDVFCTLVEVQNVHPLLFGFFASRFRKVDPLPDALTSLLASKPVRERIDA